MNEMVRSERRVRYRGLVKKHRPDICAGCPGKSLHERGCAGDGSAAGNCLVQRFPKNLAYEQDAETHVVKY